MTSPGFITTIARNNLPYTQRCLAALELQTVPCEILVYDNASTDGTARWLHSHAYRAWWDDHPGRPVRVVVAVEVQSVSQLWNAGLDFAWQRGYQEAMVVGNDTRPPTDTYHRLREHLRATGAGMVTGVSSHEVEHYLGVAGDEPMERPHPDYSCFLIAKWAHQRVRFDEGYLGAYLEDADHHVRMHRAGIQAVCINVPFPHERSATLRHADGGERRRIEANTRHNRDRFRATYGCLPGSKQYEALFRAAVEGMSSVE